MNNQPKDKCIDCGGKGVVIYKKGEHPDKGTENKYTCLSCKGTGEGETMEEKIKEILGLEVSPDGEPNFFLISDSEGNVEEGTCGVCADTGQIEWKAVGKLETIHSPCPYGIDDCPKCVSPTSNMHDEKKIEDIIQTYNLEANLDQFNIEDLKEDMKQYAEHRVALALQEQREEMEQIVYGSMRTGGDVIVTTLLNGEIKKIIKAIKNLK